MFSNPYYLIPIIIATLIWLFFMLMPLKNRNDGPDSMMGLGLLFEFVIKVFYCIPYLLFWIILLGIRSCNAS